MKNDDKSLMDKTTEAVANAAQVVAKSLKSAGEAVAEAITPKPVRAGDKLIIPSVDPSSPPVVVPVKKRMRRGNARKTTSQRSRTTKKASGRSSARKTKATKPTTARKTAVKRRKAARR